MFTTITLGKRLNSTQHTRYSPESSKWASDFFVKASMPFLLSPTKLKLKTNTVFMKRSILILLSSVLLFSLQVAAQTSKADELVKAFVTETKVPGLSISISQKGKLVFSKGYGFEDLEKQTPVDPSKTKFRIGSVSKTVTAAGLAQLYEAGKIDLDAPIETYVPSWPAKGETITLRMLAGHLAGIRHYKGLEFMSNKKYETVTEGLDIFMNDPYINNPGTEYAYSSYGWNLISAAMETAANEDFLSFMQTDVFNALDMENTEADHADRKIDRRTKFYQFRNGKVIDAPYVDNSYKWAGGGFVGTTEDLCKFGQAHMQSGYLKESTLNEWMKGQTTNAGKATNYGIGWRTFERPNGQTYYGHSGGSVGGITYFLIHKPSQTVLAITGNMDPLNYDGLQFDLMELFIN